MKSLKYICLSLVALLAVACGDDDFEPGKPASGSEVQVTFSEDNDIKQVVGMDEDTVYVTLQRTGNTDKALEVPVTLGGDKSVFSGASTVKFKAGEEEAEYAIKLSSTMKPFNNYKVQLIVDEAYGNPYAAAEDDPMPQLDLTILREDYKVVATGIYQDPAFNEQQWEQDLEYSAIRNLYRMSDCFAAGTGIHFLFDGTNFSLADESGKASESVFSGYVHPTYGNVMINVDPDSPMGYTSEVQDAEGVFYFTCTFDVSAGSFGGGKECYYITEWYEKPWEE